MSTAADYIAAVLILLILAGSVLVMTLWLAPAMLPTAAWWVVALLALAIWTAISAEITYDEEMQGAPAGELAEVEELPGPDVA